jgi:hypothetical protein
MIFGQDSPKMVDGTHSTSQYRQTAIVWTSLDGLFKSYIDGITIARTENSVPAVVGASKFFNPIGSDNCLDNWNFDSNSSKVGVIPESVQTIIEPGTALITDEGPAFSIVAKALDLTHLLDRKHFSNQVLPVSSHMTPHHQKEFAATIHDILNATTIQEMERLLLKAQEKHSGDPKVLTFLNKISNNRGKLCWSHSSSAFTFAHISDQRSEGSNSAYKANGKLKNVLASSTLCQSINHWIQVAQYRELEKIKICKDLRERQQPVSDQYIKYLNQSKIEANKINQVSAAPVDKGDLVYYVRRAHLDDEFRL